MYIVDQGYTSGSGEMYEVIGTRIRVRWFEVFGNRCEFVGYVIGIRVSDWD